MNKFGFNISLRNTFEETMECAEKFLATKEYEAIEVTCYDNLAGVDATEYNNLVKKICEKYKPWVSVHLIEVNLSEENSTLREAIFKEIENCFKFTKSLGGNHVVIHAGRKDCGRHAPPSFFFGANATAEQVFSRMFDLSVGMMKRACKLAKEYGITIFTENLMNAQLIQDTAVLNEYLNAVDYDNLEIVFDIGHANVTKKDIPTEVIIADKKLKHLHLHDNDGTRDMHSTIGEGNIDYLKFVKALKEIDYSGILMLELNKISLEALKKCKEVLTDCFIRA